MTNHWDGFEASLAFEPGVEIDAWARGVPAKRAVYLMAAGDGRAVQLLCVGNLRASLKKRLGGEEGLSRRVNYREVVRAVHWRRVDSAFEADWVYLEAARSVFPATYRGMLGFRDAWWVHVDPSEPFPRLVKTNKVVGLEGEVIGPVEDKHAAARLIELAEGVFDLCRYHNVLVEAPRGKACAYKEMGRCAAPCDGTVPMEVYREAVREAVGGMVRPEAVVTRWERRMGESAAALRFEEAGRIKARVEQMRELGKGSFKYVRGIDEFRYVVLQRGGKEGVAKVFLVGGGEIEEVAAMTGTGTGVGELARTLIARSATTGRPSCEAEGERVAMVAHQLYSTKRGRGVFLWVGEVEERALVRGYREAMKQKAEAESEEEGAVKELEGMTNDAGGGSIIGA